MGLLTTAAAMLGVQQATELVKVTIEIRRKFALAEATADRTGKELLVVGGPFGAGKVRRAFNFPAHGCGGL